ncbi:unnamed protein product, partial [Gulo gulo]
QPQAPFGQTWPRAVFLARLRSGGGGGPPGQAGNRGGVAAPAQGNARCCSMGPVPRTLELFYDVLSPYSWLGFEVLCRYKNIWNISLQLRPSFIAGIMKDSGNQPPALLPRKAQYLINDVRLLGQHVQVPMQFPKDFFSVILEKGSLSAMRFLTAVSMEHPEMLEKVSRELWMRVWSRDEDITEPQSILAVSILALSPTLSQ